MNGRACDGWVRTFRGETVLFTGTVTVNGERVLRRDCQRSVAQRGGVVIGGFSGKVTVLVYGDLDNVEVTDAQRQYSQKLARAEAAMSTGRHHVHVIDDTGFGDILNGNDARCRRLREA